MEEYGDKFFTIWYGVYDRASSSISYSSGGHPPPLLFEDDAPAPGEPVQLSCSAPMIGAVPWPEFETGSHKIAAGSRLYLYSDGVHEIHKADGGEWTFDEFVAFMSQAPDPSVSILDRLLEHVQELNGSAELDDDFSIVEARF